jgi:F0F1-type ATP synthase membrane subunit c/vacuolar-type H+-ATPase subunit K
MNEDPGWGLVLKRLRWLAIPFIGPILSHRHRKDPLDGISAFRLIFAGLLCALPLYAFVLLFIIPSDRLWRVDQARWVVPVVACWGVMSLGLVRMVRGRPLDTASADKLAASFRSKVFIGIGYAESAALVAFVGTFIMGTWWVYLVGMSFAYVGLTLVGPTRHEIARRQEEIVAQGSPLSLTAALMAKPPRPPKG